MSVSPYYDLLAKFLVGAGGAAAIVYSTIGGELPGMKKSIEIQGKEEEIELLEQQTKKLDDDLEKARRDLEAKVISPEEFKALEVSFNNQRDDVNKKIEDLRKEVSRLKRERFFTGAVFFVVLGGVFAALLTVGVVFDGGGINYQVAVAALALGAGWTGVVARLEQKGAEPDAISERNKSVDEIVGKYEIAIKDYAAKIADYQKNIDKYKEVVGDLQSREKQLKELLSSVIKGGV